MGKAAKIIRKSPALQSPKKYEAFFKRRADKPFERPDKTAAYLPGILGTAGKSTTKRIGITPQVVEETGVSKQRRAARLAATRRRSLLSG